ncbi:MAG: DUF1345 domain-containing protein [Alphaproteobacteria bacterium]|nr:DUF1345 domain-containing protein [Alphaproteobacteria bacterium]
MKKSFMKRRVVQLVRVRRRLMLAMLAGLVLLWALPASLRLTTRMVLAWDLTAAIYVVFALWMIHRSTIASCRQRASAYDQADWVILLLVVSSGWASFAAIFAELAAIKSATPLWGLTITCVTVALSWLFTHTIFTLHYANVYYRPDHLGPSGGLLFPGERPPDYRDFLYYSFVIGCAAQTADVSTVSPSMRRITLVHGVVAFAFNTAILALAINVGSSLIGDSKP